MTQDSEEERDGRNDHADRIEPDNLSAKSAKQLADYIERIERLKTEQKAIGEDIKSVYAEAAGAGVDKVALR